MLVDDVDILEQALDDGLQARILDLKHGGVLKD